MAEGCEDGESSILVSAIAQETTTRTVLIMLHGWAQNVSVFRNRTKILTKRLNQHGIDCLFVDAPLNLPPLVSSNGDLKTVSTRVGRQNARAWFLYNSKDPSDRSFSQNGKETEYLGLDECLAFLRSEIERIPRTTDNISLLGFSQGAVLVHIVAALASRSRDSPWKRIQSCILVGGFPATSSQLQRSQLTNLEMRSLHVIGVNDTNVPPSLGYELSTRFRDPKILEHAKGHVVPQQTTNCSAIIEFLLDTSAMTR